MLDRNEPAIVRLTGDHDIASRPHVNASFQAVRDRPHIIVDLTGLTSLDSTALEELARAAERARSLGGALVVVARSQRLVRLLSIAGLTAHVTITDTVPIALKLLRERPTRS